MRPFSIAITISAFRRGDQRIRLIFLTKVQAQGGVHRSKSFWFSFVSE
jgi:hypothetical protein